jgi:precorrin-8X/cobalt-precorrin-8 methylmutase
MWRFAGVDAAVDAALHAARWFAAERMRQARPPTRLHALLDVFPPPAHWGDGVADEAAAGPVPPGPQGAFGHLLGVPLGRADARALLALADLLPPDAQMRVTPWRSLLIHPADAARAAVAALRASSSSAWAFDAGDARLRVSACTGAPRCTQALGATQPLALRLAAQVPPGRHVHVSGCDKHCALPPEADALVGATAGGGWAVVPARAGGLPDEPLLAGIAPFLNTRSMTHTYETDGDAIYRQSFAIIRSEADLARFNPIEERVVCRMIHAAGLVALANDVAFAPGFATAAEAALQAGAPVLCDARMVSEGITRKRLPAGNEVICTLNDPRVPGLARQMGNTRSAAALELWRPHLAGAVVAIGNAPTALFHLLNMLQDPACPRPAAIVGCPVGFVGAAESKEALSEWDGVPWLVVRGRLGGSAVTVAAINALASPAEWGQTQPVRAEAAQ